MIRLPGNSAAMFYKASGNWVAPAGTELKLVQNGGGDWSLTTADQLVYSFGSTGNWTSVKDRDNNTTTLA